MRTIFGIGKCKLLITCSNVNGGLYVLDVKEENYQLTKLLTNNCRGIARWGEHFVMATYDEINLVDANGRILLRSQRTPLDYHGVFVHNKKAYIVETRTNSIGIFNPLTLTREDEIRFSQENRDIHHINDLWIHGNRLFLSMFSLETEWRSTEGPSGVVLEYCLDKGQITHIHNQKLSKPHTVILGEDGLYYCNSLEFEVKKDKEAIFRCNGFTRGMEISGDVLFIGQSVTKKITVAHEKDVRHHLNVSLDSGIHVFDRVNKVSMMIPIPDSQPYCLLMVDKKEDKIRSTHSSTPS
ncbi:DUF4915 domain-containing protein [Brevibacillus sp. DP1.3A]|uniref:DUF4915 domain-containing protein n=1 Tax=Brevibacillus sp. DP1.3A TaxID=2738867 RepID=UPI00156BB2BF|nr:DUF4915 domain-containing protein [Brevibacillus sp. DP1.3A]UED73402.1 TIGR03032 family protein [Brevibacillus sp. DP1.3A]